MLEMLIGVLTLKNGFINKGEKMSDYDQVYCGGCGCTCCTEINCADCNGCGCCASDSNSDTTEDNPQPRTEIINGQEICWDCSCPVTAHSEYCGWA